MKEVVIVSACRTPIGSFGGSLKSISAADLGAITVKEAIKRAGIAPEQLSLIHISLCGNGTRFCAERVHESADPASYPLYERRGLNDLYESCRSGL